LPDPASTNGPGRRRNSNAVRVYVKPLSSRRFKLMRLLN
jgi:hypothetical protein